VNDWWNEETDEPLLADHRNFRLTGARQQRGRSSRRTPWNAMEWSASCSDGSDWSKDESACYGYARGIADALVLEGLACIPQQVGSVELDRPAGVEAIPGYSVGQGAGRSH
jgi:hypothetical protein